MDEAKMSMLNLTRSALCGIITFALPQGLVPFML